VVIRRSSTREVQDLVGDVLAAAEDGGVRREAAVARLRVIGDRAVRQVLAALDAGPAPVAELALLRVLEGRDETAVAAAATRALASPEPGIRAAAVIVARGLLDGSDGPELLGRVASLATDTHEDRDVRLAAIATLVALPGAAVRPVLGQLAADADPAIRLAASPRRGAGADEPCAEIEDAAGGQLPADPQRLLDAIARDGSIAPLPTLHRLVTVLREREAAERRDATRRDWRTVRGVVHGALAARGSRVALYDIREALERGGDALPTGFTDALAAIGDAPCLEAIAGAYAASGADPAWKAALAAAARSIMARGRLTARSAAVKRVKAKHGDAVAGLLDPPR
jgi:hypothetical protein